MGSKDPFKIRINIREEKLRKPTGPNQLQSRKAVKKEMGFTGELT